MYGSNGARLIEEPGTQGTLDFSISCWLLCVFFHTPHRRFEVLRFGTGRIVVLRFGFLGVLLMLVGLMLLPIVSCYPPTMLII